MSVIDNRIVMMQFNNKDFEKNAKQTMSTLEKLKMALDFKAVRNTLQDVAGMSSKGFAVLTSGAKDATQQFNILEQAAIGALRRIGEQAASAGERLVKSLSIDQISSGFQKYETEVGSVQTIMNATGKSIEEVQKHLDKLMWFTDETSYSFSDMTSNIGKFTSAGVDLGEATEAMMGISNWAALAGQGTNEASRAMYNLSQAMSVGVVKLMDWRSIENANMATTEFKQSVIDSAVALGTLRKEGKGLYKTMNDNEVTVTNFNEALSDGWFTSGVLLKTLRQYNEYTEEVYRVANEEGVSASEAMEIIGDGFKGSGEKAFKAAQEAKTFTDAINSVKDAVSTGWLKTFDLVFGNYVEAKWMWTKLANLLWDTFASGGEYRNEQLDIWRNDFDGRRKLVESFLRLVETFNYRLEHFKETIHDVFGSPWDAENLAAFSDRLEKFTDDVVNTQHLTDRFNRAITPFLTGIKNVAVGVGRVFGNLSKYVGAFLNGIFGHDIFQPKTAYLVNDLAIGLLNFANTMDTSEETLKTFSVIGARAFDALVVIGEAMSDIFSGSAKSLADVLGPIPILNGLNKILGWIGGRIETIVYAFKNNARFRRILTGVLSVLRLIGAAVAGLVDALLPVADRVVERMLPKIAEGLALLGDYLSTVDFEKVFGIVKAVAIDAVTSVLQVAAAIKKVWEWLGKAKAFIVDLSTRVAATSGFERFKNAIGGLSDAIHSLMGKSGVTRDVDVAQSSFEGFSSATQGVLDILVPFFDAALSTVSSLIEKLPSAIDLFKDLLGLFHNEEGSGAFDFFERLGKGITNFFEDLDIPTLVHNAGEWFSGVMQGFADGLAEIKWEDVKGVGFIIGLIFTLIKLNQLEKKAEGVLTTVFALPTSIAGFFKGLTDIVTGVKGLFKDVGEAAKMAAQTHQITALAAALTALVLALAVIALMPKEAMARAVVYLGIIAIILKLLSKDGNMLNRIDTSQTNSNNVTNTNQIGTGSINVLNNAQYGWAALVSSLVGFALAMVYVFKQLSALNQSDAKAISNGLSTIALLLAMLGGFAFILGLVTKFLGQTYKSNTKLGKFSNYRQGTTVLPPGMVGLLLSLTATIVLLAGVVKSMGTMNPGDFAQGMLGITALFGLLIAFTATLSLAAYELGKTNQNGSKNAARTIVLMSASLAIISGAIIALVPAIAALAIIGKFTDIYGPIFAIGALIGAMALFMGLLANKSAEANWNTNDFIKIAASFAILAAAMDILIPVLATLGVLAATDQLAHSVIAFGAILILMTGALSALGALSTKLSGAGDFVKISASFLILAMAMVAVGAAIMLLSTGDYTSGIIQFAYAIGILAAAAAVVAAIAGILSFVPGVALILEGLAMVLGGMALVFISFAASLWIISKALPPLTEAIPPFVAALNVLFDFIAEHWVATAAIVLGLIAVGAVIGVTLGLIIRHLGGFFSAISTLFGKAKSSFSSLPTKTKAFIVKFVVGVAAALAAATPEVIAKIGEIIAKIFNYLGQLAPVIVDGLLQLLISLIIGLADAIRNNSGALWYAIADVAEALLEVLMDGVTLIIQGLNSAISDLVASLKESGGFGAKLGGLLEGASAGFNGFATTYASGVDDAKKLLRRKNQDLANTLGVDLKKFGADTQDTASTVVDQITKTGKERAAIGVDDIFNFASDKLSEKKPFDISEKFDYANLVPSDMFSTDVVDNAFGGIQVGANGLADGVGNAFGNMADMSGLSMENILANSDGMVQGLDEDAMGITDITADLWGNYAETTADGSEDAREAVEGDIDGTLSYMRNKETSFYQAGVNMMQGLQNGLDYQFQFVKGSIVAKANQLIHVFEREQQIESPSKVWMGLGGYMMLGLANGIEAQSSVAVSAVSYVASAVNAALEDDTAYQPTIRPVVDMSMVSGAAGTVRGFFAGQSVQLAGINGRLDMQAADLRAQMDQNRIYNDANVVASISGLRDDVNALNGAMSNMQVVMDTGAVVGATAPKMDQALYQRAVFKGRGN